MEGIADAMGDKIRLSYLDSLHISVALEDCLDQLAILGRIMPNAGGGVPNEGFGSGSWTGRESAHSRGVSRGANNQERPKESTLDQIQKIESDRKYIFDVLSATATEISTDRTFHCLTNAVNEEKKKKTELQEVILQEENSRRQIKQLQKAILEVKREKEVEIQKRNEMIAHLKDQLQETKAKVSMESKYIKKDSEVRVACTQKQCQKSEEELKTEIETLRQKIDEEERVNVEIETFLRSHYAQLEEKLEYWMEKHDKDVEAKQQELDTLKASKANDLARLQELTLKYNEYEEVVLEDRAEKERERRKAEQEEEKLLCCVKIQSWWRGVMVRRQLGSYSKKKKKKGKKGKKGGKKGKKGKK